jgi:hypothetical protein
VSLVAFLARRCVSHLGHGFYVAVWPSRYQSKALQGDIAECEPNSGTRSNKTDVESVADITLTCTFFFHFDPSYFISA